MVELRQAEQAAGTDLLDDRMRELDRYCVELARDFREPGMALDRDPDAIDRFLHLPGVGFHQYTLTPPEYRPALDFPPDLLDATRSSLGWVVLCERFAHGDPGVMLASPGPSLSGGVVNAIGDAEQVERYYGQLAAAPTHTFFGLTEPDKGSAVTELRTTLTAAPDGEGWLLNGEKRYIGNGARAKLGVVFCRRAPGPWGIEAVMLDPAAEGVHAELLPMMGLRGARISRLRFTDVRIPSRDVLGAERRPSRRGLYGALHILYRARPGIAALALGCAQSACDYLDEQRPMLPHWDRLRLADVMDRLAAVRQLVRRVAAELDRGEVNVHAIGGAKSLAAQVAEDATLLVAELLGPAALIEHPWFEKVYRDVRAFELMEGTSNLHRMSVFQGLLKGNFLEPAGHPGAPRH